MLPARPAWLPPDEELRRFFGRSALYPYYRLRLAEYIARLLPPAGPCSIVDVGAGDGSLGAALQAFRPRTSVVGLEVEVRAARRPGFPLVRFDGHRVPARNASFDVALLSNVLHHADDPCALLQEVRRITRRRVIIKDHLSRGTLDDLKLAALDLLGNLRLGAQVKAAYLGSEQWSRLFEGAVPGVEVTRYLDLPFRQGLLRLLFANRLELMLALDLDGPATA